MSTPSEFELDLDLQLLPAWARQPSTSNRYAHYEGGGQERPGRRGGDRFPRRDRPRSDQRPGGRGPGRGPEGRREGPRGGRGPEGRREERPPERPEPEILLPELQIQFVPEDKGVESLAKQIKLTGRAYPLFQVAMLILRKAERFEVHFAVKKGAEGQVMQPLLVCSLDETPWLTEDEVAAHVLRHHFDTFYQTEKVPTDPPKGTYTLVAQCGMSGAVLGPPNYHDYQTKLRKLHAERFAHMPFETYKARVRIVRDEAVVKQWIEEQSVKCEFVGLNLPEPLRLGSREEVERHFRETHLPNLIKSVEAFTLPAGDHGKPMARGIRALMRKALEDQRRFPLKVATVLSQQLASHGLQFFKVNKTVTHVCVARPHYLDIETTVVSDSVRKIVEFINAHPGCNRRRLLDTLAPAPPRAAAPPAAPAVSAETPPAPAEGASPTPVVADAGPQPTPEQTAIITDLHWLVHQGHVIEFTDGRMETAKKPAPRPAPAPKPPKVETPVAEAGVAQTAPPASDSTPAVAIEPVTDESPSVCSLEPHAAEAGPASSEPAGEVVPGSPTEETKAGPESQPPAPAS